MPGLADAFASIESSGNPYAWNWVGSGPNRRRSRYRGLYQFGPDQERRYGITDWTDVGQQRAAFNRHIGDLRTDLSRRLGRAPQDWELYFGHQQGPAGSTALLGAAPGTPAWRAIRRYYGSDALARQAITGNIPRGHALYGRDPETIMADQFAQMWRDRFGRTGGAQPDPGLSGLLSAALSGFSPFGTAEAATPAASGAQRGSRDNPYVWRGGSMVPVPPRSITIGSGGRGIGSDAVAAPGQPPVVSPLGAPNLNKGSWSRPDAPSGMPSLGLGSAQFSPALGLTQGGGPPPAPPVVPPFGAPTVTPGLPPGASEVAPMVDAGALGLSVPDMAAPQGPQAPPGPDADAIVRGAEQAAAARSAEPQGPSGLSAYLTNLAQNPMFLAGLSILGTAPGGNWGPAGAQALAAGTRGQRERAEFERVQSRRSTMDRVWRQAFGADGQPNMSHPLMQGMPPELAATIYAMGPEAGLPALQRFTMLRAQQAGRPQFSFHAAGDSAFRFNPRTGQAERIEGGGPKAPAGFRWNADRTALEAIPGGPGTQLPAEVAGRLAMLQAAAPGMASVREFFTRGWTAGDTVGAMIGHSRTHQQYNNARRNIRLAIEGSLRAMTGAAAPESEVAQYMAMFMPSTTDTRATARQKLDLLQAFMTNAQELVTRGRRTGGPDAAPGAGWTEVRPGVRVRELQ